MATYNASVSLPISQLPKDDLQDELMDIHNTLEILAQRTYGLGDSIEVTVVQSASDIGNLQTDLAALTDRVVAIEAYINAITITSSLTYDALPTDYIILLDTAANTVTVNLPELDGTRFVYIIKVTSSSNNGFIVPYGTDTVEGVNDSYEFEFPLSVMLVASDSGWWII